MLLAACGQEPDNATEVGIDNPAEVEAMHEEMADGYDAVFVDAMTESIFQHYLRLRTALVESDGEEAVAAAKDLTEQLTDEQGQALTAARVITEADNLDAQRAAFADLSEELAPLFSRGIKSGTIYRQHCPMAFDGAGADWISDAKEIRNPYFGDKMLTCGSVVETIQ